MLFLLYTRANQKESSTLYDIVIKTGNFPIPFKYLNQVYTI